MEFSARNYSIGFTRANVYDGRDRHISAELSCANCTARDGAPTLRYDRHDDNRQRKTSKIKLQLCTRCRCLTYCSKKCQIEDYPTHKEICKEINRAKKEMEEESTKLMAYSEDNSQPENMFVIAKGRFWGYHETRDYMCARNDLIDALHEVANRIETTELWEMVLHHSLEMLRLSTDDNLGIRRRVPILLLNLNRDDDAYSFCRYWETLKYDTNEEIEFRNYRHKASSEGEWIYPSEKDCRYRDYFMDCSGKSRTSLSLPFLVAMCIIKMRIVAAYDQHESAGVEWTGAPSLSIESNRKQVGVIMDQIHANNPSMLPAIINPSPFTSKGLPGDYSRGCPSEAAFVLSCCDRAFLRVPGAVEALRARFGPKPEYNRDGGLYSFRSRPLR